MIARPHCFAIRFVLLIGLWFFLAAADPAMAAAKDLFRWRPFLAPFHSVVLHFPIGFVTLAFILELYSLGRPGAELRRVITLVLVLSIVSSVLAIALGLMRAGDGGYEAKTLNQHRVYGMAVGVLTLLALVVHWLAFHRRKHPLLTACYRTVLVADIIVITIAGHQGGNLTHGSKYLVMNAPDFIKEMIEDTPEPEPATTTAGSEKDRHFAEKVKPILQAKCFGCHGPEKQKGELRLDQKEFALKGGKSGQPAVKPGAPLASSLVKCILLPPEDDDVMPPAGKGSLTPEEIMTLIHWVQNGAHFPEAPAPPDKSVASTEAPPKTETKSVDSAAALVVPELRVAVVPPAPAPVPEPAFTAGQADFTRDIRPLLEQRCIRCHGAEKPRRGLRLDTLAGALAGGKGSGPAIIPGRAEQSPLFKRVAIPEKQDPCEEHMPPPDKGQSLTPRQIAAVRAWINEGAPWPPGLTLHAVAAE